MLDHALVQTYGWLLAIANLTMSRPLLSSDWLSSHHWLEMDTDGKDLSPMDTVLGAQQKLAGKEDITDGHLEEAVKRSMFLILTSNSC